MSHSKGRHRRGRTLPVALVTATAVGAGGVYLVASPHGADAAEATTVTVATTAELEKAFAAVRPGTTIQLRAGTYHPTKSLKSQTDGTPERRITVTAHGTHKVVIDGSKLPSGQWLAAIAGDHWTLSNLTFRNSPAHGVVVTSSVGGVFRNLTTHGNGDSGFTLRGHGTVNNLIENLDSWNNYDAANHGQNADGLAIKFGSGEGNRVVGARLYHNADDGLDLWKWESPIRIERSWAYGNGVNRWKDPAFEGNGNGFKLGGGGVHTAHIVTDNAAWKNTKHGFTENSNQGAMRVHRNTAYNNAQSGFYFATSPARLSRNLSFANAGGTAKLGSRAVVAANSWGPDAPPTDNGSSPVRSVDARTAEGPRKPDGSLPTSDYLRTGTALLGAPMN
ncbi:right-handed parallel beta-helix repeat-containing protein [Streptomyces durbertensis]|uniref:Right-handed parallel beta-helix repeat-containing protein n=1 Tax=Streptomyces durbertensis TaxID=2448886 RepID=A0ABR6EJT3_9ACTN|nr:right-handed parallel beta-helix repeat-containing protein [Streptomyces durbertensis]MBB1245602.1 right-handed parallel beta-helix repeat-containing protein [Streptomyces durbertensis]